MIQKGVGVHMNDDVGDVSFKCDTDEREGGGGGKKRK